MENEQWKSIKGFDKYEVSSNGIVRTIRTGHIRKPQLNKDGYMYIHLMVTNIKTKNLKVHRVVADTFLPKIDDKIFVDHINGIKTDNRLSNIRWCSFQENIDYAWASGAYNNRGESHGMSILSKNDVVDIKILLKSGKYEGLFISKIFGVTQSAISDIKQGRTWKHVLV